MNESESNVASTQEASSLHSLVSLHDCLREINHALNYWYPTKATADEEERNARHVRLFQFRDRLERELKANDKLTDSRPR